MASQVVQENKVVPETQVASEGQVQREMTGLERIVAEKPSFALDEKPEEAPIADKPAPQPIVAKRPSPVVVGKSVEQTVADNLSCNAFDRAVAALITNLKNNSSFFCDAHHFLSLCDAYRKRLLAVHVFSRLHCGNRNRSMPVVGSGDEYSIH